MSTDAAHTKGWQISEVVFGVPLLIAIALGLALPISISYGPLAPAVMLLGAALILTGTALVILARREFARHGEHTDPGHPTGQLMTTGVFSISRNPLYLGIVFFLAGIALAGEEALAVARHGDEAGSRAGGRVAPERLRGGELGQEGPGVLSCRVRHGRSIRRGRSALQNRSVLSDLGELTGIRHQTCESP